MDKSIDFIISENFFKLLEERNISQVEYANAVGIDRTLLSKWKSGKAKMTVEQINDAAKYFGVSVDYLYGIKKNNDAETIKINDSCVITKKRYLVKRYEFLYKYKEFIGLIFGISILIGILCFFIYDRSEFWLFLLFFPIVFIFEFDTEKKDFETSPHIEINIKDHVYYTINDNNNLYFKKDIMLYIIRNISLIPMFLYLIFSKNNWSSVIQITLIVMVGINILASIAFIPNNKLSKQLDDLMISSYGSIKAAFVISVIILAYSIILLLKFNNYILIILSFISMITFLLSLIVESKKFKGYYLVVEQHDGVKRVV